MSILAALKHIFGPPKSVKQFNDSVRVLMRKCEREVQFATLGGSRILNEICEEAKKSARSHPVQLQQIKTELGVLVPQARVMMTNVAFERIASGQYHIYRGMLSPEGNDVKRVLDWLINEIETAKTGAEDLSKLKVAIREAIARAG